MQTDVLFNVLDENTKNHSMRVQKLCKQIAGKIYPDDVFIMQLSIAARYHDIGKVHVPRDILDKPGRLNDAEYGVIKKHPRDGFRITQEIFHRDICEMILYHHENENGSGYYGRKSLEIPLGSQIIHVCDVYDALTTERPYRKPMKKEEAIQYLKENSGIQFRVDIVRELEKTASTEEE